MTEGDFDDAFDDAVAVANGDRHPRAGSREPSAADPGGPAGPPVPLAAADGDGPDPSAAPTRDGAGDTFSAPTAPSQDPAAPSAAAPASDLDLLARLVGEAGTAARRAEPEHGPLGSGEPALAEYEVTAFRAVSGVTAPGHSGAGPLDSWASVLGPMASGAARPTRAVGSEAGGGSGMYGPGPAGAEGSGTTADGAAPCAASVSAGEGPTASGAGQDGGTPGGGVSAVPGGGATGNTVDAVPSSIGKGPALGHPAGTPGFGPAGDARSEDSGNTRSEEVTRNPEGATGNARSESDANAPRRPASPRTSGDCSTSDDRRASADRPASGERPEPGSRHVSGARPEPAGHRASGDHSAPGPRRRATPVAWPVARQRAVRAAGGPRAPQPRAGEEALGRTLAEPLTALTDLPPFDTSAMDGWAVSGPGPWNLDRVAGDDGTDRGILAGHAATTLADGHAVAIATGARVPDGATAVLRSEHGEIHERSDGRRRLAAPRAVPLGQDIRPRGQECGAGEPLLPAGVPVTPAVLGLAAAAGYDRLTVRPRPRVEVLVLGDELLQDGLPREGRIRDALGPMLGPWLRSLGVDVIGVRPLGDDADALHAALTGSTADVVLTTGGTASGPVDHVHPALRRIGAEVLVDGVAVRPGHPMLLARIAPDRHLVGLPGNPLAAISGLLTLAEPLLRALAARPPAVLSRTPLSAAVAGHPHDTRLVPVAYRDDARHGRVATPLPFHGPAMLRGIAAADALVVVPPGGADQGDLVGVLELPWPMGSAAGGPEGAGPPYGPGPHPGDGRPVRSTFSAPPTGGAA